MTTDERVDPDARSGTSEYVSHMQFGVLGSIEASDKRRRLPVGGPKQRTVLALLIARAGTPVSTEALVDGVYGDDQPQGARRSIQTYVSNLRGDLGDVIEAKGSGYVLSVDRSGVDALRFEDAVSGAADVTDPERASELLRDALSLWRGHSYADVDGFFELTAERSRLSELRMSAIELRVDADLERGHHRQLIAELDSLTEEHPLREGFRAQQMLALYRCGRQAEALRAYEKTRSYLVDEMGLDPSPDLRDLEQRILGHDSSLGFESGPTVKHAAILVADISDPGALSTLDPTDRYNVVTQQSDANRNAAEENDGHLFAHRGSAIFAAFEDVEHAVNAAVAAQQALADTGRGMRMAISVGEVEVAQEEGVLGPPVTRAARLVAAAHGGQILLSAGANQELAELGGAGWVVRSLGQHDVDGSGIGQPVYQLTVDGLEQDFPPLRTELFPFTLPTSTRGLPGYELREEVGSGSFGVVHRAYQPSVGREVAIKIIRPEFVNDPQFIRRFEIEAQLVARLEHPHIVPLHDYWRNPDGAYLVMRWLGGGTLEDEVARGNLTVGQAHSLLVDIGPALAFAHRRGVVHRDIKLSNVILDDEGGAYLTDFGIASDIGPSGIGSVAQDVQALAGLLARCVGPAEDQAVVDLLATSAATEIFPDARSFIAAWEKAVGAGDTTSQAVGFTPTRNPYKGLSAFGELDAADFHGRDAEVDEIINTLADHRLVAVVGPSGIGKSSIVRAGMIPALRDNAIPGSERWLITDMLPGAYPYEELTTALMRVATEIPSDLEDDLRRDDRGLVRSVTRYLPEGQAIVLVIDQFEELFTLASGEEREAFLAMLTAAIDDDRSNVRIVVTMRADFFDHPLRFAALGDALRAGTIPISAPNEESLQSMIVEPAAGVGVEFEAGLVDRIVVDVRNQPGALPLLEFSLAELFNGRDSDLVTLEAYGESGGVLAALGRRAEGIYASLEAADQDATRETFLRLVNVSDSGRATRRRARLTEIERLGFSDLTLGAVLDAFADHRLVTFDRDPITRGPTVEVAHEAILTEWPRLADWIGDHREDLLLRSRLAVAVADWEAADRSETYLLTGGRLGQHESWTTDTELSLTSAEQEFLSISRHAEDERRAKRRRNRRLVMSGFAVAAMIALVLAVAALVARNDAQEKATLAAVERDSARAAQLGAAALEQISTDPERSLLLSIESLRTAPTASGLAAVHAALLEHYATWAKRSPIESLDVDVALAIHPNGQYVIVETVDANWDTGHLALYDLADQSDEPIWRADVSGGDSLNFGIFTTWFGDQEVMVAFNHYPEAGSAVGGNGSVMILDIATGEILKTHTFSECVSGVIPAIPTRGRLSPIAVVLAESDPDSGECDRYSADSGVRYFPGGIESEESIDLVLPAPFPFWGPPITASADGRLVAFGNSDAMYVFDAATGEPLNEFEGDKITISSGGDRVLIMQDGYTQLVERETGDVLKTFPGEFFWSSWRFSNDDSKFVAGSFDGATYIFDLETGEELYELRGQHYNPVISGLTDDPSKLLIASGDTSLVLDLSNRSEVDPPITDLPRLIESNGYNGHHAAVTLGGGLIYVPFGGDTGSGYQIYDYSNGTVVREANDVWLVAEMSSDGQYVVEVPLLEPEAVTPDGDEAPLYGRLRLVDAATGGLVREFESTCPFYRTENWPNPIVPHESCGLDLLPMPLSDAEFSADASRLGVDTHTGTPLVFDVTTGSILRRAEIDRVQFPWAGVIALSPDGSSFYYGSGTEGTYKVTAVNVDTGEEIGSADQISANYEIVFSEDGTQMFVGNWSGIIYVYDTKTYQLVDTLTRAQGGGILDVAPNGSLVATATFDNIVRVQTLDTHELAMEVRLNGKTENIEWLNGNHLMVISSNGSVLVFTMDTGELQQVVRSRLTRGFTEEECASFDIDPCPTLQEIRNG